MKLKGRPNDDTLKMNMTMEFNSLSCEDFQRCFQKWQERWDESISSAVDYFEGTNSV
jgi:hypothetical protein